MPDIEEEEQLLDNSEEEEDEINPYQLLIETENEMKYIMSLETLSKNDVLIWLEMYKLYSEEIEATGLDVNEFDYQIALWMRNKMWRFV